MDLDYEKNLGGTDRVIRATAGVGLVGLVITRTATGLCAYSGGIRTPIPILTGHSLRF